MGGCSCRASAFPGLAEIFQRLYITGVHLLAITAPFFTFFIFKDLRIFQSGIVFIMELQIQENSRKP